MATASSGVASEAHYKAYEGRWKAEVGSPSLVPWLASDLVRLGLLAGDRTAGGVSQAKKASGLLMMLVPCWYC